MELIELVSELLYTHNCVIIPEFGGFVGNFKHSEFDEKRMLLSPARKKVAFNQSLRENDGLLINALMKRKDISYEQSEKEVGMFVSFLNDRLEKYRNYEFRNLGSFYLNKDQKLIFVAYEGLNFYKKSYGLQEIKLRTLSGKSVPKKSVEEQPKVEEKVKVVPISTPKRRFYIPQVAASVVILAVCGIFLWQFLNNSPVKPVETAVQESSTPQEASIIPDLSEPVTVSASSPEITEVTDELIARGELKDDRREQELKPEQEQESALEQKEKDRLRNASAVKEKEKVDKVSIPDAVVVNELVEEAKPQNKYRGVKETRETARNTVETVEKDLRSVYYIAIAKLNEQAESDKYLNRIQALEYSAKTTYDNSGQLHMCIERFTNEKNAKRYLSLVKRFDYPRAYLIEIQE